MGAYDRVNYNGVTVNRRTAAMLDKTSDKLGYDLSMYQGSYNTKVGPSAGTHAGGGAVDLSPADWRNKVRALRSVGFAAWHRPELWLNGVRVWPEHVHAIAIGDAQMSSEAASQVAQYKAGTDGLAGHSRDTFPYHPSVTFDYAKWLHDQRRADHDDRWEQGDVYLSKLKRGTKDSDSVRRLQTQLKRLKHFKMNFVPVNGKYGPLTARAVKRYQRRYFRKDQNGGKSVTREQALRLFNDNYNIHK